MAFSFTAINGRICSGTEIRYTQSQKPVCSFCVAVDNGFDDNKATVFYNCVAWNKTAEFIDQHFNKGDGILLSGKMLTRKWTDKNGSNRIEWELNVEKVDFPIGSKKDNLDSVIERAASAGVSVVYSDIESTDGHLPF